jgi:hypothetical protein
LRNQGISIRQGKHHAVATFLIDRQGGIAAAPMGLVSKGVYEKDILSVLHEQR